MAKHIVTGIKPYDFTDEKGRNISGIKVYYFDDEAEVDGSVGFFPLNLSIPADHRASFIKVPGLYDLDFKQKADAKGRPVLTLRSVEFIQPVEFHAV